VGDGEDRLHVFGQRFAKSDGINRKSAPPVPLNCNSLSNRFAAIGYAGDPHGVSVRSLQRRDDRHAMSDLGQRKQRVRCATFQQNIGPDVGEAASGVEEDPDRIARVQQQQRIRDKVADIYDTRPTEIDGWRSDSQGVGWWQEAALEPGVGSIKSDAHMSFTAFEHRCLRRTESFGDLDMDIGKALGIPRQKPRQHALDRVRWRGDLEHSPVAIPQDLCAFADGIEIGQYATAIREELLAFCGQNEATPHVIEEPQAQFLLKIADLSRQRRLSNAQPYRSLGYAAQFSDCNKGP